MKKYQTFLVKVAAIVIPLLAFFAFLSVRGYYPLLTDSPSFDAKIRYAKEKKIHQTDLIAIGSSMTLNNLSSTVIKDSLNMTYFNFGCWGLQINNIYDLAINHIPRYKPKYVIVVSSITDFWNNSLSATIENYLNTNQYVRDHFEAYFYIKNFNPLAQILFRKRELMMDTKVDTNTYSSLCFDDYGGVLLNIPKKNILPNRWNDHSPFPTKYTSLQYRALNSLAVYLKSNNIKFIFVQTPIKKQYTATIGVRKNIIDHINKCKNITENEGGIYLSFFNKKEFLNDSLFVDQYHLSAYGATLFSKNLVHELKSKYSIRP